MDAALSGLNGSEAARPRAAAAAERRDASADGSRHHAGGDDRVGGAGAGRLHALFDSVAEATRPAWQRSALLMARRSRCSGNRRPDRRPGARRARWPSTVPDVSRRTRRARRRRGVSRDPPAARRRDRCAGAGRACGTRTRCGPRDARSSRGSRRLARHRVESIGPAGLARARRSSRASTGRAKPGRPLRPLRRSRHRNRRDSTPDARSIRTSAPPAIKPNGRGLDKVASVAGRIGVRAGQSRRADPDPAERQGRPGWSDAAARLHPDRRADRRGADLRPPRVGPHRVARRSCDRGADASGNRGSHQALDERRAGQDGRTMKPAVLG